MPPSSYRNPGDHVPVASASAALTAGTLVRQEAIFGVVITGVAQGDATQLDTSGVHRVAVPASTVKGDLIWSDLSGGADIVPLTLSRTPAAGNALIGVAIGDRDSAGKALLKLAPIGVSYNESAAVASELATLAAAIPAAAVADVATANADATYGQPEADLINELKTQVNALLARLRTAGILTP